MKNPLVLLSLFFALLSGILIGHIFTNSESKKFDVKFIPRYSDESERGLLLINHSNGDIMYLENYYQKTKAVKIH